MDRLDFSLCPYITLTLRRMGNTKDVYIYIYICVCVCLYAYDLNSFCSTFCCGLVDSWLSILQLYLLGSVKTYFIFWHALYILFWCFFWFGYSHIVVKNWILFYTDTVVCKVYIDEIALDSGVRRHGSWRVRMCTSFARDLLCWPR